MLVDCNIKTQNLLLKNWFVYIKKQVTIEVEAGNIVLKAMLRKLQPPVITNWFVNVFFDHVSTL